MIRLDTYTRVKGLPTIPPTGLDTIENFRTCLCPDGAERRTWS